MTQEGAEGRRAAEPLPSGDGGGPRPIRASSLLAPAAVLLASASLLLLLFRHNLFFDETVHLHVTWLLSRGLAPWRDFFFTAPVAAQIALSPLLRILPEGGYLVLVFRAVAAALAASTATLLWVRGRGVGGYGILGAAPFLVLMAAPETGRYLVEYSPNHAATVAAVAAFLVLGKDPLPRRVAAAAFLSVLSVGFNPKFALPLALGGTGFFAAACLSGGGVPRPAAWGLAGAAAGTAALWLLHAAAAVSFPEALRWAFLFQGRYQVAYMGAGNGNLLGNALLLLFELWPAGLLVAAGLAGWLASLRRGPWRSHLAMAGILAGALLQGALTRSDREQDLLPILVTLCVFSPCAAALLPSSRGRDAEGGGWAPPLASAWGAVAAVGAALLLLEAAGWVALPERGRYVRQEYAGAGGEMAPVSALESAARIDGLLSLVPPGETVVALWFQHPLFRRDATAIVTDEGDSFSLLMPPGEPARRLFDPAAFAEALDRHPPAYVAGFQLAENYPPGWLEVLDRFLRDRGELYASVPTRYDAAYVRRDLWDPSLAERIR